MRNWASNKKTLPSPSLVGRGWLLNKKKPIYN